MELKSETRKIPGINDHYYDFITENKELFLLHNGEKIPFKQWPNSIIIPLNALLLSDSKAQLALDDMGMINKMDRLKIYTYCNFGGYDSIPDFADGKFTHEYWECGYRGKCKYEGSLCALIHCANGILSPREVQVLKFIATGLQDKEIAAELNLSENTIHNHRANITEKTGLHNRTELARFAIEKNISK